MSAQAWVEDRWYRTDPETGAKAQTTQHGQGSRWRARYVDPAGREQNKRFRRQVDAEQWLAAQSAAIMRGDHVAPRHARMTVEQWGEQWLTGYQGHRPSTIRQAKVHLALIDKHLGSLLLVDVKPTTVRAFTAALVADGYAPATVYAVYRRLAQVLGDAVHDGVLARNPCSRRTSPPTPKARPYVVTTEQVWAVHDAAREAIRPAVLLGAFAGLRLAEVAGLRTTDVDFMRGVVHPEVQWGDLPLKTETSRTSIPIPRDLATLLATGHEHVVSDELGRPMAPWTISRGFRAACEQVEGLPETFGFHDLRHYYASTLVASGLDVKTVQARCRHASAKTTLDTYGHLMPDADDGSRAAVGAAFAARARSS